MTKFGDQPSSVLTPKSTNERSEYFVLNDSNAESFDFKKADYNIATGGIFFGEKMEIV